MLRPKVISMLFALAAMAVAPGISLATPVHVPFAHFSAEVVSGAGAVSGFGVNSAQFRDPDNLLEWETTRTDTTPMELHREYLVRFIADPGWAFDSVEISAFGQAYVGVGTWRAGPVTYTIGDASGTPIASGLLNSLAATASYSPYYAQNGTFFFFSNLQFTASDVAVPASSFTVLLTTDTYLDAVLGSSASGSNIQFRGSNVGTDLPRTWELIAAMTPTAAAPVPEPATLTMMGLALLGGVVRRRKRLG